MKVNLYLENRSMAHDSKVVAEFDSAFEVIVHELKIKQLYGILLSHPTSAIHIMRVHFEAVGL
jgi:hypothetical protein